VTTNTTTFAVEPGPRIGDPMIRVLVVDDHAPLRRVLAELFSGTDDITVVGECRDGDEVVDAAIRTRPDVVLMDLNMPGTDGLEATRRLLEAQPQARVVMLTGSFSVTAMQEASASGRSGSCGRGTRSTCSVRSVTSPVAVPAWSGCP
jgi:DNA-binding NarL/FixJ family response regulator